MSRRRTAPSSASQVSTGSFVFGTLLGLLAGSAAALWYVPLTGMRLRQAIGSSVSRSAEQARAQVESVSETLTADPVAESLAEGKAAARRRREALGLVP